MKILKQLGVITTAVSVWLLFIFGIVQQAEGQFTHPGVLFTQSDLDRIAANAVGGQEPWTTAYGWFSADAYSKSTYVPHPVGHVTGSNLVMRDDSRAAYQNALMWYITGTDAYRTNAIGIINSWSYAVTNFDITNDITAYISAKNFCTAGEILAYENSGWAAGDISQFQGMLVNLLYPAITNTIAQGYGGNQQAGCVSGIMAMGIFMDNTAMYDYALNMYQTDACSSVTAMILPTGQECEEGRDQAHCMDGLANMADTAQMAWCQGTDLYSLTNNLLLAGFEYFADYNLGGTVPYQQFGPCNASYTSINPLDRGRKFNNFEIVYNHYVVLEGLTAPNTTAMVNRQRPEISIDDDVGWGTLLYYSGPAITVNEAIADGTNSLISQINNTCVDIQGASKANTAVLVSSNYVGSADQKWAFTHMGLNVYGLVNENSGLSTDIPFASMTDGQYIQQYTANGGYQQFWKAMTNVDGTLSLYNFNSGYAMTITNGQLSPGANLVQNLNSGANMPYSQEWTVGTPSSSVAAAPTGMNAYGTAGAIALTWNADSITTSYNVYRSTTGGGPYTQIATGIIKTNYNDTTVSQGTIYYYVVTAVNQNGESAYSSEVVAQLGLPAPWLNADIGKVGVAGNSGYDYGNGEFIVNGSGSDIGGTADSGQLAYVTTNGNGTIVAQFSSATWVGSAGKIGLMIRQGLASNSVMSAIVVDYGSGTELRTVTRTATGGSASWINGPSGVVLPEWLKLQRAGSTVTAYYSVNGSTWTSLATNTVSMSGTVYMGLIVCSRSSTALATGTFDGVTAPGWTPPAPNAPTGLSATGGSLDVNLNWTQSTTTGLSGNNVYRSSSGSGGPYSLIANLLPTTSYSDTSASAGATYYYYVTAVDPNGESAASSYAGATTIPAAPTGLSATAASPNQNNLSWTAATGATSYNVYSSTVNGGPYSQIASGVATASYADTSVSANTTYYYVVTAVNGTGESPASGQASATTPALPTGWASQDIGAVGVAGSAIENNGTYTVSGSGSDIGAKADSGQFAYVSTNGDATFVAELSSATWVGSVGKAGVMIRQSLSTNAIMSAILFDHGNTNQVRTVTRTTTGGTASWIGGPASITLPEWLKLQRAGSTITTYYSANGTTWTPLATNTVSMSGTVYMGLMVCSRNNSSLATTTFTNVTAP